MDGLEGFADHRFVWLDSWVDSDAGPDDVLAFATSTPVLQGSIQGGNPALLKLADVTGIQPPMFLLVDDGAAGFELVKITSLAADVATLQPALSSAVPTTRHYFLPDTTTGRVFPALVLDSSNNTWNSDLLPRAGIYFPKEVPIRQRAIAVSNDPAITTRPQRIALSTAWGGDPLLAAPTEFIVDSAISAWNLLRGDTSTNPALAWEYWNGTGWWRLQIKEDRTHNLKNSGSVTFEVPET